MSAQKTLRGPGGLRVELDRSQVFPDDPGAGTPAMVELKGYFATYWCACAEGELADNTSRVYKLTPAQAKWLDQVGEEIDKFLCEEVAET